jgi:phage protein D
MKRPLNLKDLNQTYGDFYVPAFVVKVGKRDAVRDLFLTVTGVEIDLKDKGAANFSFSVASAFDWETREFVAKKEETRIDLLDLFAFGSPIEISLGYGEPSRLKLMLKGIVTEIGTSFTTGAPELKISGFDDLYKLGIGKNTKNWEQSYDSDAVRELVRELKPSANIVQTKVKNPRIDQNEESDLAFIEKLAGRNEKYVYYVRDDKFYFGPRHNEGDAVVDLIWGEGLLSFSPQLNLVKQVTEVVVYGRSASTGEEIFGIAGSSDVAASDKNGESGAERVAKALKKPSTMKVRMALRSQAEANARAKAILDERAQEYVTGDGECIGVPEIAPDMNILLQGIGTRFTNLYYVSEATHKIDSNGYRTTFKVQDSRK